MTIALDSFNEYMAAPCHELDERDAGRNDPHSLCFDEWGVPREMLFWLWEAAMRAAAQLSTAEVLEAWQPIETAPKTGRTLLLGYPNVLGKWRTVRGQWMSEAYIAENWEEPDDAETGWYETSAEADDVPNCWPITPTHWMPLPIAPKAKP